MSRILTPQIGRRHVVRGMVATAAATLLPGVLPAVAAAAADGAYAFRTIKPVAYPGRTPHIHFAVTAPGRTPLITQMYVAGEPQNGRDGILNAISDRRQRDSVIVSLQLGDGIEARALAGSFDIVLAG